MPPGEQESLAAAVIHTLTAKVNLPPGSFAATDTNIDFRVLPETPISPSLNSKRCSKFRLLGVLSSSGMSRLFKNWTIEFCIAHLSGGVEQSLMARLPRICAVKSLKELSPTLSGDLLHCSDNNAGSCEPCIAFHIRVGQLVGHVQLRNEEIEQHNCDQDSEDDHTDPYSRKLVPEKQAKRGRSSASLKNCRG